MTKTVKTIDKVYGKYADYGFVIRMLDTAEDAVNRIKMERTDLVKLDTCHPNLESCSNDLDFWEAIVTECKRWVREH